MMLRETFKSHSTLVTKKQISNNYSTLVAHKQINNNYSSLCMIHRSMGWNTFWSSILISMLMSKKWRKSSYHYKSMKIEISPILWKDRFVKDLESYFRNVFTPYVLRDIPTSNAVQCYINDEACMKGGMNINKYVCHSIPYTVATSFTELFFSLTSWPSKNNTTVFSCPCCGVLFASFEFGDSFQTFKDVVAY